MNYTPRARSCSRSFRSSLRQYIVFNLGMSPSWEAPDFDTLVFPSKMYIDYVRVYQRHGTPRQDGVGCDPPNFPTMDYIARHADAYYSASQTRLVFFFVSLGRGLTKPCVCAADANYTYWRGDISVGGAGQTWPKNSQYDGC